MKQNRKGRSTLHVGGLENAAAEIYKPQGLFHEDSKEF